MPYLLSSCSCTRSCQLAVCVWDLCLQAFVDECIMTYECGYTEGDLEAQAASCAAERRHLYSRSGLPEPPDMVGYCEQDFLDCVRIVW